jgi:hypothetical protein
VSLQIRSVRLHQLAEGGLVAALGELDQVRANAPSSHHAQLWRCRIAVARQRKMCRAAAQSPFAATSKGLGTGSLALLGRQGLAKSVEEGVNHGWF